MLEQSREGRQETRRRRGRVMRQVGTGEAGRGPERQAEGRPAGVAIHSAALLVCAVQCVCGAV